MSHFLTRPVSRLLRHDPNYYVGQKSFTIFSFSVTLSLNIYNGVLSHCHLVMTVKAYITMNFLTRNMFQR